MNEELYEGPVLRGLFVLNGGEISVLPAIATFDDGDLDDCVTTCLGYPTCVHVSYNRTTGTCLLHSDVCGSQGQWTLDMALTYSY